MTSSAAASKRPAEPVAPALSIKAATTIEDAHAITRFMAENATAEMCEAAFDPNILLEHVARTVRDGAGLMAVLNGELVGFLGVMRSQYCYSAESFLHDAGLYVLPEHRGGDVFRALLQEARGIADAAGMILKIIDTNPTRARPRRGRAALTGEIIGYRPAGRVMTFSPQRVN